MFAMAQCPHSTRPFWHEALAPVGWMVQPDLVNEFLTLGLLKSSPPWSVQTCLSLHGGLHCARKCFSHSAGAALEIQASPCMTPSKWLVASVQAVSPFMPLQSSWCSESEECRPENWKSMDGPWRGNMAFLVWCGSGLEEAVTLPAVGCCCCALVCLALMHVGQASKMEVVDLKDGTPLFA